VTPPFLVCPFDENLLGRMAGRSLVVRTSGAADISGIIDSLRRFPFHLHCLSIETNASLADILFQDEWTDVPFAVRVSGLGRFLDFMRILPTLRKLNLRVYMPADSPENVAAIRILSSLGINTALIIRPERTNWDLLADLVSYAYFGLVPHAPIEPFDSLATWFDDHKQINGSSVYFEDPTKYLHVDTAGRIALTPADAEAGSYVAQRVEDLETALQSREYQEGVEQWRTHFLQADGCAFCPGWRICMGQYAAPRTEEQGCQRFFSELLDSVELYRSQKKPARVVWQP